MILERMMTVVKFIEYYCKQGHSSSGIPIFLNWFFKFGNKDPKECTDFLEWSNGVVQIEEQQSV